MINPGHFWVQMEDANANQQLTAILKKVKEKNKELLLPVTSLSEFGTCVFAPVVGQNTYNRAMIQSYSQDKNVQLAQVLFVDTGKTAVVKLSDLRQLRPFAEEERDLINLFNLPAQAFECVLANIRPTFMSNITGQWSPEAHKEFYKVIQFDEHGKRRNLFGQVYSVVNSVVSLTLLGVSGSPNSLKKFNVNEHLIKCRYAEHKEEDYLSRTNHELRLHHEEMSSEQQKFYEDAQYDQYYLSDSYPEPPEIKLCHKNVTLRGPFSPLEIDLMHLTSAGAAKKVSIKYSSVFYNTNNNFANLLYFFQDKHRRTLSELRFIGHNSRRSSRTTSGSRICERKCDWRQLNSTRYHFDAKPSWLDGTFSIDFCTSSRIKTQFHWKLLHWRLVWIRSTSWQERSSFCRTRYGSNVRRRDYN